MTDLPSPLVAPDVDLRDFQFLPLDVLRLRDSDLAATPDAEVFRAAVLSWCVSWHQVPAASLPNEDVLLARLLGYGRDVRGWQRIREAGGLRGWILCSDGRLYHPVVAEKAADAWSAKQAQRARTEAARKAREAARQSQSQTLQQSLSQPLSQTPAVSVTETVTDSVTASKGQGQGQGQGESEEEFSLAPLGRPEGVNGHAKPRPSKRVPPDFEPDPADVAKLRAELPPDFDLDAETAKFRDHEFAKARSDWGAVYRGWMRRARDDRRYARKPAQETRRWM